MMNSYTPKRYKGHYIRNDVSSGHGTCAPSYLVIHETANPGATAKNHMDYWRNNQPNVEMSHFVMDLDGKTLYQAQRTDTVAWHVGNGNRYCVGIELCHATARADFTSQWGYAVAFAADFLEEQGWAVSHLLSHHEAALKWGGSDHTDPDGYFQSYGATWAKFKQDVASALTGASTDPTDNGAGHDTWFKGGTYRCTVDVLNVRDRPTVSGTIVTHYRKGQTVVLDSWYTVADGYVWGRYTGYSGRVNYIAVGKATGKPEPDDYLVMV